MKHLFIAKITVFATNTLVEYYPVKAENREEAKKKIFTYYKAKKFSPPDIIELNETIF